MSTKTLLLRTWSSVYLEISFPLFSITFHPFNKPQLGMGKVRFEGKDKGDVSTRRRDKATSKPNCGLLKGQSTATPAASTQPASSTPLAATQAPARSYANATKKGKVRGKRQR
jgi:hypothetical protein